MEGPPADSSPLSLSLHPTHRKNQSAERPTGPSTRMGDPPPNSLLPDGPARAPDSSPAGDQPTWGRVGAEGLSVQENNNLLAISVFKAGFNFTLYDQPTELYQSTCILCNFIIGD